MSSKTVNFSETTINKLTTEQIVQHRVISKTAYVVNTFNAIGSTIFENLYQYIAIFLGSAGLIQGFITSVRQLGNALLNPVFGRLTDKFGRKRFLIIANFLLAINAILVPNSPSLTFLFVLIVIQTILNAMIIPTWAGYLGDITAKSIARRGSIIGRIGMITTLISNFLLVGVLYFVDTLDPQRIFMHVLIIPFYLGALTYLASCMFAFKLPTLKDRKTPEKTFPKINFRQLSFPRPFVSLILLDSLFTLTWAFAWPIFPYVNFSVANTWFEIGLLALVSAIFTAIGQNFTGLLMEKFVKKKVIILGRFFFIFPRLFYVLAVVFNNIDFILVSNMIVGLMLGGTGIAITTLILDNSPEENRSSYQALYLMVTGLSAFAGSTLMGIFMQLLSGNNAPSNNIIIMLFLLASFLRALTWTGFFFLKET